VNSGTKVEASEKGHDEEATCLLSLDRENSKWCLDYESGNNWVKFIFVEPIELHAVHIRFADDW
jgi:hypothetical protein